MSLLVKGNPVTSIETLDAMLKESEGRGIDLALCSNGGFFSRKTIWPEVNGSYEIMHWGMRKEIITKDELLESNIGEGMRKDALVYLCEA
tara:strand:+ start:120 stop:389 length:270 start_codon:yes stop_codon:yes gene_type:complete